MTSNRHFNPDALQRSSPEPLYRQMAALIEAAVRDGALKPGDRLDSEELLTKRFQVSRITVRQAIEELARKRIVVRKQGKGTFVTVPAVRHDLRRPHGLFDSLFSQASNAGTRLLRYELKLPPPEVASAMNLKPGVKALALDRLYLVGSRPIGYAEAWLDPSVEVLSRTRAEIVSTEEMMREAGIRIAYAQVSIRAETAGTARGRILRISPRGAVLVHRRSAIGADGAAKEVARISVCSDSYEFVSSTQRPDAMEFDVRDLGKRTG